MSCFCPTTLRPSVNDTRESQICYATPREPWQRVVSEMLTASVLAISSSSRSRPEANDCTKVKALSKLRKLQNFLLYVYFVDNVASMASTVPNGTTKRGSRKRVSQVESGDAPPAKTARTEPVKKGVADILDTLEYGPAPESAATAQKWLDEHDRSLGHFIDGKWYRPSGRSTYDSVNQATGEKLATTLQGTAEDVEVAVTAARKAFKTWSTTPGT